MKRRSFLVGGGAIALAGLTGGCDRAANGSLKVRLLKDSIPPQLIEKISASLKEEAPLDLAIELQVQKLFADLQRMQQQPNTDDWRSWLPSLPFLGEEKIPKADLVTIGDYWLVEAIRQGLIQPLNPAEFKQWQQLPSKWQQLVRRNNQGQPDAKGQIWGAPYRWGTTVIAYRRDKFKAAAIAPPTDWSDLWRKDLRDRISLLNQPREVIGLTLKKLGSSYNIANLDKIPNLQQELQTLHKQVKFYSSNSYLQPLIIGDTWLAVGWSTDVLSVMRRYSNIAAIVPKSGTAIWADLWVSPAKEAIANAIPQWIDFFWQPDVSRQLSQLTSAVSPILASMNPQDIPESLQQNSLLLPPTEVIKRSEFLLPLSSKTTEQYKNYWAKMS
jgi:putative spermidine/putrescine transport system substrate-binding protein